MTPERVTLMIVGAHAGDAENMAGAIAAKYGHSGHNVFLVHMTLGERGSPKIPMEDYAKQKKRESEHAASLLRATPVWLAYRDGEIPEGSEPRRTVAELIRRHGPDIVITHWHRSMHRDHCLASVATAEAVLDASLKEMGSSYAPHAVRALYFAENWEDTPGFEPELLIDVSDYIDIWKDAVEAYEFARGVSGFNYLEYYTNLMRLHGLRSGVKYAEALMRQEHSRLIPAGYIPLKIKF
jgi:LmbE family N-acetylglucosaminyl deacetylase